MERKFFNWENWDRCDDSSMNFYDCTLLRDMGEFKTGTKIPSIYFDFDKGFAEFYNESGQPLADFKFDLVLVS